MIQQQNALPERAWFKQFWPWFLILLPASGVIAGIFTIVLAVQNAPIITNDDIGRFARDTGTAVAPTQVTGNGPNRAPGPDR